MLTEVGSRFSATSYIGIGKDEYQQYEILLSPLGFEWDKDADLYLIAWTEELENLLISADLRRIRMSTPASHTDPEQRDRFESVHYWYWEHWKFFRSEVKTDRPGHRGLPLALRDRPRCAPRLLPAEGTLRRQALRRRSARPRPAAVRGADRIGRGRGPEFSRGPESGAGKDHRHHDEDGLSAGRACCASPRWTQHPERHYRPTVFICDEYQNFATVGGDNPTGDERFLSLSRQPKCIPIVATQSVSSLKEALPNEGVKTLLQAFRTKVFLTTTDPETARYASELCGKADRTRISYTVSESSTNANVGWLVGRTSSSKGSVSASKQYQKHKEPLFEEKVFFDLKNAQSVVVAFDGVSPLPPTYCYLKPDFLPVTMSWFEQERIGFDPERISVVSFEIIIPFLKPIEHLLDEQDHLRDHGQSRWLRLDRGDRAYRSCYPASVLRTAHC